MKKEKYDFIIPMGEGCFVAQMMDKCHLRVFSAPLDWAGARPFAELFASFISGFERFFEKEDLHFHQRMAQKNPHCDVYLNEHTKFFFPHDFPIGVPFDVSFPKIKEKYDRRIQRLDKMFRESQRALIVHFELAITTIPRPSDEELIAMAKAVAEKYPTTHTDILYVAHNEKIPFKQVVWQRVNDRVLRGEICNSDPAAVNAVVNYNSDNVLAALRSFSLNVSPCHHIRRTAQTLGEKILRNLYCEKFREGQRYHRILGISFKQKEAKKIII